MVGIVYAEHTQPWNDTIALRDILLVLDTQPIVTLDQLHLWQWISDYYMCPIGDVMSAALPAKAQDRQYSLDARTRARVRSHKYTGVLEPAHALDAQQQFACNQITQTWSDHPVILLHGVTSSGKTEVYIHCITEQLAQGNNVLYLVPEIALTTQLTTRLERVFGNQLLVYHSRVSDGQRMEIYRQQLLGSTPHVVLGARSAVFLPVRQLGLVIVDEEHEPSYKQQDPAPRYHARSLAIWLANQQGAHTLLGTATPSLESWYNVQTGKYGYVAMTQRYQGIQLPQITMVDLTRQYHRKEMYGHFADPLVDRIREVLADGKQVILFQNRRGYAPYMQCVQCAQVCKCPDCDVSMTLHQRMRQLVCHCCGHTQTITTVCPHCGKEMKPHGFGTERIEDEIMTLFPGARVSRMDLDTTRKKDDYQHIIDAFSRHEVDILIGTQMVTKGLHFEQVSLVAVLHADSILNQPSIRSYERAFQMLEQVAGRAGRSGAQGQVIIQTFDPSHFLFQYVQTHDYEGFAAHELNERKAYCFPPYYRQITLILKHPNETRVQAAAQMLQQRLACSFGQRVSGVILPSIARAQRYFVRQISLRIELHANTVKAKKIITNHIDWTLAQPSCKSVIIYSDVDPM